MGPPAMGKSKSHAWKRGEDLENKNAERIKKGVVGSTGKKAPITPKAKLIQPRANNISLTVFFYLSL